MPKKEPKSGATTVALLADYRLDGVAYAAGDVVELDGLTASALIEDGTADDAEAAIAYRLEQGATKRIHAPAAA